ncbi:MAG TPA: FadR/GntR family transcriptional regulator [Methylomusa anaerophila]|uniref:HTH-type transcriptional regulator LutR n=1 Tax=Methylomusa anaerophila TaxID=1930071 RepID=A0A348AFS0_9FIRM|nr:FadR/GntR family transcriptional regulator [Methylomusa anaerophila]BBB89918.1 HTH-type transcriptional regulator LutR [Methylomusa anaerophila]HML88356.1 FadR/GntR family transcriptional regulator [Methylomusa anaerophila]
MFRPVKTKKVYEEIVEQIKTLISEGKLQPGDKLPSERELSERFNVSRASVREAFSALEIIGVITIHPGEGSFVRQVSVEGMLESLNFFLQVEFDDIMQLLEVRKILEVEIAGLAAVRATPLDIEAMQAALNDMVKAINSGDIGDAADAAFHYAIIHAAHNPILNTVMNPISEIMTQAYRASRQKLYLVPNMPETLYKSHYGIYEAVVAKDSKLAVKRMREHLVMVEEAMLELKRGGLVSLKKFDNTVAEHKINKDFGFPS